MPMPARARDRTAPGSGGTKAATAHDSRPRNARPAWRALAALGRAFIGAGVVILLFVVYQLWGTGLLEARSQRELRDAFERRVAAADAAAERPEGGAATSGTAGPVGGGAAPAHRSPPPAPPVPAVAAGRGDPIAVLRIPKLGIDKVVVEGTDLAALQKGPGHEPGTALPGQSGNAVIAGHRTTYGAPFYRLNELEPGDALVVRTVSGEVRYTVTGSQVVEPTDVWVLAPTADDRLTLYTCTPRFSAAQRLVVTAKLDTPRPAPAAPAPTTTAPQPPRAPPVPATLATELAAASGSIPAAAGGTAATALTAAAVWWAGRRYRRLIAYPLGAPVVVVTLFFTFERVAAFLPSAV